MKLIATFLLLTNALLAESNIIGHYMVPVKEDTKEAQNEVTGIAYSETTDKIVLEYNLPEDLLFNAPLIKLESKEINKSSLFFQLEGKEAFASCTRSNGVNCLITYFNLNTAPEKTKKFLLEKYKDEPKLLEKKLKVAEKFRKDIIGVLFFELTKK